VAAAPAPAPASRRPRWIAPALAAAGALAAFLGGRSLAPRGGGRAAVAGRFELLTDRPGVERRPRLSPDGKSFLYVSDAEGNDDIFIQRVGGRAALNLTKDSPLGDGSPAFSPDGSLIAFHSARDGGGVFVMGATGESVRRVTDEGFDPDWSPDGREIVVSTEHVTRPNSRGGVSQIWAVDVASGKRRLVSSGDGVDPRWSPGGHRIAFWGIPSGTSRRDIWTIAADGSQSQAPVPAVSGPEFDWGPAWAPDGRHLFFSSDRGGSLNFWRVPIEETTGKILGPPEPVTVPAIWAGELSFSRDGTLGLFSSQNEESSVQVVPFDPVRERIADPPQTVVRLARLIWGVDWSPDAKALVLCVPRGSREDLYVIQADGSGYRQLTDAPFLNRLPRWSPDGKRIAFTSNRGGTMQTWTIGADGSGLTQLTNESPAAVFPVWSADGERLAMAHTGGEGSTAFLISFSKPKEIEEMPSPASDSFAPFSFSPDGRTLAGSTFSLRADQGVYLYSLSDRKFRTIASGRAPVWFSDGRRLLFQSPDGGISLVDAQSGRIKAVMPDGTLRSRGGGLEASLSSDDRKIAYIETHREGDVWLMHLGGAAPAGTPAPPP
jgi:Tol biopolymer transport system component